MNNPDFHNNPPQILVVDDQKTLRLVLCKAIEKQGYRVIEACNGEHCLDICHKLTPDMILLDGMMPRMDGFECSTKLHKLMGKNCPPILMITVLDDQESIQQAFQAGASDYITKPIDWGLLTRRVNRLLTSRWAVLETRRQIERECRLTVSLETANRELQNLVHTDIVTQLASRSYFNEYLQREWKRLQKYQLLLTLILFKIDFPELNYQVKDEYLQEIADIIRKSKRHSTDFIARYSDEEFAIILANTQAEETTELIKTIQTDIKSLDIENEILNINFGVTSIIPNSESSVEKLVKNAEEQLIINNYQLTNQNTV